jgi:hypothetical protein
MRNLIATALLCFSTFVAAQTTNISVGTTVINAGAQRGGINLGSFDSYQDIGLKNFLAGNPGFEPYQSRQIFQVEDNQTSPGQGLLTTTQVQANLNNLDFDEAPLNYYPASNAIFKVEQSSGSEAGCTSAVSSSTQASSIFSAVITSIAGTSGSLTINLGAVTGTLPVVGTTIGIRVANVTGGTGTINGVFTGVVASASTIVYTSLGANTTGTSVSGATVSSGQGVMYTLSTPCSAPIQPGDIFSLTFGNNSTANLGYTGGAGSPISVSGGGATISSENTDVCTAAQTVDPVTGGTGPGCGTQSLVCDTTSGGSCTIRYVIDNTPPENFVLFKGDYLLSFMSKAASGSPTISVNVERTGGGINYTYTPTLTGSWTQEANTQTLNETATTSNLGELWITITMSGAGVQYLDNVFWGPATSSTSQNKTQFRDELVNTLEALKPAILRYWAGNGQNAETMANWVQPMFLQQTAQAGLNGVYGGGDVQYSLPDFLNLCKTIGAAPHFVIPLTSTISDVQDLTDYLFGSSSTTYGAIRIAQGGPSAAGGWATVFPTMYGELGNENWNSSELGQGLGFRAGTSTLYYDYGAWAATRFAAIRAMPSYNSALKLVVGVQTAQTPDYSVGISPAGVAPQSLADAVAINGYYANTINTTSPTLAFYQPTLTETWSNTHDPESESGFEQQLNAINSSSVCGTSGTETCQTVVYEENFGTGNSGCNQACLDALVDAGIGSFTAADQTLENVSAGINAQSLFEISQYYFFENGYSPHIWGAVIDMGGQSSVLNSSIFGGSYSPRPTFLGLQQANGCIIGPELETSTANNILYDLAANSNGVSAISDVPTIRTYAFKNGSYVCLAILNADTSSSYPITFSGTNAPEGTVAQVQIAPPALSSLNEATGQDATNTVTATVSPTTTVLSGFNPATGITVPPFSVTTLTYAETTAVAATPTFSPAAGSYSSYQTVTISDLISGATIYYTTDGSTPTTSSTVYSGPFSVNGTETVYAIATATGYYDSEIGSAVYTITQSALPIFSPGAGTYQNTQTITVTDSTPDTTIYYTWDGTTPTTSSAQYTQPLSASSSATLKAIAAASGYTNSGVASAAYTFTVATPVITPTAGTYSGPLTVTITCPTTSATLYYTTDGTTPTASSSLYTAPLTVSSSETIKVIGVETGFTSSSVVSSTFTIEPYAATPTFSPSAGTYTTVQTVTISDSTAGATVYYTTNGSTPTSSSTVYSAAITVSATTTLKAIAGASGYSNSAVSSAAYTINLVAATPTFSPAAGAYTGPLSIILNDTTPNSTIYFTTDGSTPTTSSFFYTGAPIVVNSTETIKAMAVASGYANSDIVSALYTINSGSSAANPTFSPAAGTYTGTQSVVLSDTTPGATIYFTVDGSTPTTSSFFYTAPITVNSTETIKAMAVASGYANSPVAAATYTIVTTVATPAFAPVAGTYTTAQTVTLSDATAAASIYYTTNGTTPTTSSTVYSGPITVSTTETLKAIAVATGLTNSAVATAAYTIQGTLASPSFSPAGGTFTTPQTVTINHQAVVSVYFTTDGSNPTTSSMLYTGPITVSSSETIKAIAVYSGWNNSPVAAAVFTISP